MARPKKPLVDGLPEIDPSAVALQLEALPKKQHEIVSLKRRYSVTGDVLSYNRCKRQYGFFVRRQYTSASSAQLFFGTVIHETLDRAHMHYRGELPGVESGDLPDSDAITRYFCDVEDVLRSRGIRPMSRESRQSALDYILRFNSNFGHDVYPRVVDTEHTLQADKGEYILHGIVDVIARSAVDPSADSEQWSSYEIWDYKGSKKPAANELEQYEFQMRVYADLYKQRNGNSPKKAILLFLGEEDEDRMRHDVDLSKPKVATAIGSFDATVMSIEASIEADDWSDLSRVEPPSKETCDACDIRWSCPSPHVKYKLRAL